MAIEIDEHIDLKIRSGKEMLTFTLLVMLELSNEKEEAFKTFKSELEEKYAAVKKSADTVSALKKKMRRAQEDVEDLVTELEEDLGKKERAKLLKQKRKAREVLRNIEDTLEAENKTYDAKAYEEAGVALLEGIAQKSFDLHVEDDANAAALRKTIAEKHIKYSVVVTELNRVMTEAKKKKK